MVQPCHLLPLLYVRRVRGQWRVAWRRIELLAVDLLREVPGEFPGGKLLQALAEGDKGFHELPGPGRQRTSKDSLPAHFRFDELHAEGLLPGFDAPPDIAVALAQVGRALFDRSGAQ